MFNLITILKRVKYQFYNLFNSEKEIPSNYKLLQRRDTSFQHFVNRFCKVSSENEINAFVAKKNTPLLVFRKVKNHKIELYW